MKYKFLSPIQIWDGYNPCAEPLDTVVIQSSIGDGIVKEACYFTVSETDLGKTRAFATVYRPEGGRKLPALVIADKAEYYRPEQFEFLAKEGFAVISFDYSGKDEGKSHYTMYPKKLDYCNFSAKKNGIIGGDGSVKQTNWYVWTLVARRAITFATSLFFVDDTKVGVIGLFEGAILAWQTAAMDGRVAALCSVFGWDKQLDAKDADEFECLNTGLSPRSYMPLVSVPTLLLSATNRDFDTLERTGLLSNFPTDNELYFSVSTGYYSNVNATDFNSVITFFNGTLKFDDFPAAPVLTLKNLDGMLYAELTAHGAKSAEILFARGDTTSFKTFKAVKTERLDDVFIANVPIYDENTTIYILGKAYYDDYALSDLPVKYSPKGQNLKINQAYKTNLIYNFEMGLNSTTVLSDELIVNAERELELKKGAKDIFGITSKTGGLSIWIDKFDKMNVFAIQFDAFCHEEKYIKFTVQAYIDGENRSFSDKVWICGDLKWQRCVIDLQSLKSDDGLPPLEDWQSVTRIDFNNADGVLINNLLWI